MTRVQEICQRGLRGIGVKIPFLTGCYLYIKISPKRVFQHAEFTEDIMSEMTTWKFRHCPIGDNSETRDIATFLEPLTQRIFFVI